MARPTMQKVWQSIGWAVIGFLAAGWLVGIVIAIATDESSPNVAGYVVAGAGAVAGGIFGWHHDLRANPTVKRVWRTIAWTVLGLFFGGIVGTLIGDQFDSITVQNVIGYVFALPIAVAAAVFGWTHDLQLRPPELVPPREVHAPRHRRTGHE